MVVSLGDYFHRLFRVNEEYVLLAINVMSYLVRICRKTKTKIRLIYGTESHEMNQYRLFNYHLSSESLDMKIITTVTEESVCGNSILYLPEEYMGDKSKHYSDTLYSGKAYDYILGHGIISEGMPMVRYDDNQRSGEKKVPHFRAGELQEASKLTVFGHYHVLTRMKSVYYLGSLFRDSFGEEDPKGYGIAENHRFTFVENTEAYLYRSYRYNDSSPLYGNSDLLVGELDRIKKDNVDIFDGTRPGKIRLIFDLPSTVEVGFREKLQSLLSSEKQITTLITETKIDQSELLSSVEAEYDFILDKNLNVTDKIYRYISKKYPDTELTYDELIEFIGSDLKL